MPQLAVELAKAGRGIERPQRSIIHPIESLMAWVGYGRYGKGKRDFSTAQSYGDVLTGRLVHKKGGKKFPRQQTDLQRGVLTDLNIGDFLRSLHITIPTRWKPMSLDDALKKQQEDAARPKKKYWQR